MSKSSAFTPKENDLSVDGYDNNPLIFKKNSKYCYIERNGSVISCGDGYGKSDLRKFKIPESMTYFKQYIDNNR
jgi:hypothetical protein